MTPMTGLMAAWERDAVASALDAMADRLDREGEPFRARDDAGDLFAVPPQYLRGLAALFDDHQAVIGHGLA